MKNITIFGTKFKTLLMVLFISTIVFILLLASWDSIIYHIKTPTLFNSLLLILFFLLIGISFILSISMLGIIIFGSIMEHYYEKKDKECFEIVKNKLSNEFKEIKISKSEFPFDISKNLIKCMAKLDENNNIVYNFQIDTEITSDNYITFTDHFEVEENLNE